jgi:hypothetical protein
MAAIPLGIEVWYHPLVFVKTRIRGGVLAVTVTVFGLGTVLNEYKTADTNTDITIMPKKFR